MKKEELEQIIEESHAYLKGHFLLSSGRHSPAYLQCAKLLQYPQHAAKAGQALADLFQDQSPDLVVAPALGGVVIGHEVGRALGVRALFTERVSGEMTLRRGFKIDHGERVIIVEDVVTTGGSILEVADVVRKAGAELLGFGSIIDRSGGNAKLPAPLRALLELNFPTWAADECPLCKEGGHAEKPGSRSS